MFNTENKIFNCELFGIITLLLNVLVTKKTNLFKSKTRTDFFSTHGKNSNNNHLIFDSLQMRHLKEDKGMK